VYPGHGDPFTIAANDPDGGSVTITWSQLPLAPVKVQCDGTGSNPAINASVVCSLMPTSGLDTTDTIKFIATDALGATGTITVTVGPASYVAMGDSYSAGEGDPPFDPDADAKRAFLTALQIGDACHRSPDSWARQLDISTPYALSAHIACSGAIAANVTKDPRFGEAPQIQQLELIKRKYSEVP
jgi:hypothetical protein